jgi:mannose-6-phosphate isomerase-like protein (cupin superfamily)
MTSHFTLIASGLDVAPLLEQIDEQPGLWNERPERRGGSSPHRETSDIWVRYAAAAEVGTEGFMYRPHRSAWWPAYRALPAISDILMTILDEIDEPVEMGGILMTRIPPGCQVYEHHDKGTWHSEHYTLKTWTVLRGNPQCVNTVEGEEMVWKPGDCWSHDNLKLHSVRNEGASERIVLICCFRRSE